MTRFILTLVLVGFATLSLAQEGDAPDILPQGEPPMTLQRLADIIRVIDADARAQGAAIEFTVQDIPIVVIADPRADRMRAMVPIRSAEDLEQADLLRMMQANFDSALDARYAVAKGRVWGVFIHPLSSLEQDQFLSAVAQIVNVTRTYGQSYSGGAQVFGGGDSNGIYQDLLEDLRKGQAL
ncbi:hypothetical protein ROLI_031970 [Roseobacter fucihabitans]|uniref:Uncharacterized protein n=1 Tax=Roseobacter fucihabitans TaxID=1537242 RepID=A0ABZ2BVN3_9RHOB|nr:hypothetical protein [Roseobacter litoralis]MBC6965003.1 hypothetical protein [Roseobacter litoralis]